MMPVFYNLRLIMILPYQLENIILVMQDMLPGMVYLHHIEELDTTCVSSIVVV